MSEKLIDIEVNLGKELAGKINKMTKTELINNLCVNVLRGRVQQESIETLQRNIETLKTRLVESESCVEQGRAMITAVIDRW